MAKNHIKQFAKYAGLATVALEWSALLFYYLAMPAYFGNKYPISYYATLPQTTWVFSICYTLAAISFWIFAKHHLKIHYRTPTRIFGASMLFFAGMALFPYNPADHTSTIIHTSLAYAMGISFLIGMFLIAKAADDKHLFRATVAAIALNVIFTLAFVLTPKGGTLLFAFEAASWLMTQLWIIWISYHSFKKAAALNDRL